MKGTNKFREKLPSYQGKKILILPLIAGCSLLVGLSFLVIVSSFSRLIPSNDFLQSIEFILPVVSAAFTALMGWILIFTMWKRKDTYLELYKERAYQRGIFFGMVGIPLVIATVIYVYAPIDFFFGHSSSKSSD